MSVHTVSELNALKAGLHDYSFQKSPTQKALANWLLPKYKLGDYFVTLTFQSDYKFKQIEATKTLRIFLRKINRKLYGVAYDKGHKFLKCDCVFEQNASDGWHIHMLLESPKNTDRFCSSMESLITNTWVNLNWGTAKVAQKVIVIKDGLESYINYITKDITKINQSERLVII